MLLRGGKFLFYMESLGRIPVSPWIILRSGFSSDIPIKKSKLAPLQERKMIDRFRLWAKGGDGGNGCASFRKSRHDRRGRPDESGQRIVVAQGGNGGLGNMSTANPSKKTHKESNTRVSDDEEDGEHVHLSAGMPGSEVVLVLELKSIADVGLVGMPNAGKSTLLGAMSKAKPTVGHYAFTTLRPNLGNLNYEDFSITVADIPGIIRDAHENRGLGHAFLRHIEQTKVLAYVVDLAAATTDGRKGLPPWKQLKELVLELEFYQKGLSDRPSLVVANKLDEEGAEEVYEELKQSSTKVNTNRAQAFQLSIINSNLAFMNYQ